MIFLVVRALVLLLAASPALAQAPAPRGAAAIIAEVNGQPITRHDLEEALAVDEDWMRLERQGAGRGAAPLEFLREKVKERVLDQMIEDLLLVQAAKDRRMDLTPEEEKDVEQDFVKRAKERWGSVEALEEWLKERGTTIARFRREIRDRALVKKYLQAEAQKLDLFVRPQEIRDYYAAHREEYRDSGQVVFSHIDIMFSKHPKEEARKIAEEVLSEIRSGKDFAEVARARSEGVHAGQGGEWKAESLSSLRKDLAEALGKLKEGEISGVVEARDGFVILKLHKLKGESFRPFEEVEEEIAGRLRRQKIDDRLEELKAKLRTRASVRIAENALKGD
jgi:parvulin-like peptidyl-prolyl isomerase